MSKLFQKWGHNIINDIDFSFNLALSKNAKISQIVFGFQKICANPSILGPRITVCNLQICFQLCYRFIYHNVKYTQMKLHFFAACLGFFKRMESMVMSVMIQVEHLWRQQIIFRSVVYVKNPRWSILLLSLRTLDICWKACT